MMTRLPAKILTPPDMRIHSWDVQDDILHLSLRCLNASACCPNCGSASSRVHGWYNRLIQDLPCQGYRVRLHVEVRRFQCGNTACTRRTFAEPLRVAWRYQRRSRRLQQINAQVGLALGGAPGARLLAQLGMHSSGDTLLRTLGRMIKGYEVDHPCAEPQNIGIDDWAFRRGHVYGTIVVDLQRHRPIDLLPDRDTKTVAAWLAQHPDIRVVTRDRANAYAEAIRQGAPAAMQVADRWHLLKNLGEALERLLSRHQQALRETALKLNDGNTPPSTANTTPDQPALKNAVSQQRRARRLACYEDVVRLHRQGVSISAIARDRHLDRKTVRGWLAAGSFPERASRAPMPGKLKPYEPYLRQRWEEGCRNGAMLLREITGQGYRGGASNFRKLLTTWRQSAPAAAPRSNVSIPSPRCISAWLVGTAYHSHHEPEYRQRFVEHLCSTCSQVESAKRLATDFIAMVKNAQHASLPGWVQQARAAGIREMHRFAEGLEQDWEAVKAALATSYSNGMVEGHINRLKMLKRQMYGRAGLALLRTRVLYGQIGLGSIT